MNKNELTQYLNTKSKIEKEILNFAKQYNDFYLKYDCKDFSISEIQEDYIYITITEYAGEYYQDTFWFPTEYLWEDDWQNLLTEKIKKDKEEKEKKNKENEEKDEQEKKS